MRVRVGAARAVAVPVVVASDAGGRVRLVNAADLAAALGATVTTDGGRALVTLPAGTLPALTLDVADAVPFARLGGREVPLVTPARVGDGRILVPLHLVADALPAADGALRFDPATRTLAVVPPARPGVPLAAAPDSAVTLPSIVGRRRPSDAPVAPDAEAEAPPVPRAARRRTVVVDAGHGGVDPGMRGAPAGGPVVLEKDVTLGIARALRAALADRGLDVVLTRDRDTLVALADRGRIANARRGDLFVSLHVNAANPAWRDAAAVRGFETYFLSEARTGEARDVAARENESVRFEAAPAAGAEDPLRFIVSDLAQNEYLRVSQRLAQAVQRRLGRVHPAPSRGVQQAGFKVLVTASMPAVLVEVGYGTNAADAAYITGAAGQRAIAAAIADAAVEHLSRYGGARGAAAAPERRP